MDYNIFVTLKINFHILLIKCVDGSRCVILGYPEQIIFDFNLSATVIFLAGFWYFCVILFSIYTRLHNFKVSVYLDFHF